MVKNESSDSFNPFSIIDLDSPTAVDDAYVLVDILVGGMPNQIEPIWIERAKELLAALLLHNSSIDQSETSTLSRIIKLLSQNVKNFRSALVKMKASSDSEVVRVATLVENLDDGTLQMTLSATQSLFEFARGELVQTATAGTSFDLNLLRNGDPVTIYIVMPSERLESHRNLLRLWIGRLILEIAKRQQAPNLPTLLLLDETYHLGSLDQLQQAITLLRDHGLNTWTFWQDVAQLVQNYDLDWQTMYNNCRVVEFLSVPNMMSAQSISELAGAILTKEMLDLDANEMLLQLSGDEMVIAQKVNYLSDACFMGMHDPNPRYQNQQADELMGQRPRRVYQRQSGVKKETV